MSAAFDTYEAAKEFKAAGFSEAQVEALVNVSRRATTMPDMSNLATKPDMTALSGEVAALRAEVAGLATKPEISGLATKAEISMLVSGLATKAEMTALVAGLTTKAEVTTLVAGLATKTEIALLASREEVAELKADLFGFKSEVRADIASAKFQVVAANLAGMVAILSLFTVLSKLTH